MIPQRSDDGVALINVLLVMAISAALVQTMLTSQETAIKDVRQTKDRAQAYALARGGVASLRTALRRDLMTAPESDHLREPWALVAQQETAFDFGSYSVSVTDAQGRFDLNSLTGNALTQKRVFDQLLGALDLPPELGAEIVDVVARKGPLPSVDALLMYGISANSVAVLDPYVTTLLQPATINLNTASEPVLEAVFANAIVARSLGARRASQGFLIRADLSDLGVVQPALAGWQSHNYDISVTATVGDVTMTYDRRVLRDPKSGRVIDLPSEQSPNK
ncbi:type II secretion system minor pseudopilin GspK [Roseobacter sp. EG26]|uniref:type II secretion system minor pseudopilin GspK n=1 Tax=Roseobacter sp. EG26 TaxID=3412477 RepID=UPI003CE4A676